MKRLSKIAEEIGMSGELADGNTRLEDPASTKPEQGKTVKSIKSPEEIAEIERKKEKQDRSLLNIQPFQLAVQGGKKNDILKQKKFVDENIKKINKPTRAQQQFIDEWQGMNVDAIIKFKQLEKMKSLDEFMKKYGQK